MRRYIVRRIFQGIFCVIGVSIIIFVATRLSGDVSLLLLPQDAKPEDFVRVRAELHLDKPLWEQYLIFASKAVRGDFGDSYRWHQPAIKLVLERMPATIELALVALAFTATTSIAVGTLSALKPGSLFDTVGKTFAMLGQAIPSFWLGIVLILFFSVQLRLLPSAGRGDWRNFIMPAISLGWYSVAAQTRMVRSSMLDVLDSEYIKLGRVLGIPERLVIFKYGLRNALIPVLTLMGIQWAALLGGSVIVETIFAWPGVGRTIVEAIWARDYQVVQAGVFMTSCFFIFFNLLVDVLYAVVDPRIRYS
jgi:peptide/nickel transport system permease protein